MIKLLSVIAAASLSITGVTGDVPQDDRAVLNSVDFETYSATQDINSPFLWGLDFIDRDSTALFDSKYRQGSDGSGVIVYIIDDGLVQNLDEFSNLNISFVDVSQDKGTARENRACQEHGTNVASMLAGKTMGVARNVNLTVIKASPCDAPEGVLRNIGDGIDWILSNHPAGTKGVVNMSFGSDANDTQVRNAFQNYINSLRAKGVITIAAAGNEGDDACKYYPAGIPEAITVGALEVPELEDTQNKSQWSIGVSDFSNTGSCIDIWAPGKFVASAAPNSDGYSSGTSMAAPYVAGAAARIIQENPTADLAGLENLLLNASTEITSISAEPTITKRALRLLGEITPEVGINPGAIIYNKSASKVAQHKVTVAGLEVLDVKVTGIPEEFQYTFDAATSTVIITGISQTVAKYPVDFSILASDGKTYTKTVNLIVRQVYPASKTSVKKLNSNLISVVVTNPTARKKVTIIQRNRSGKVIFKKTYTIKVDELGKYTGLKNGNQLRVALKIPSSRVNVEVWVNGKRTYKKNINKY